jgi:hypothetical protein
MAKLSPAQIEARRKGGRAVIPRVPPPTCTRCGKSMAGRSWHSYLGHRGLHGLADSRFGGDLEACQRHLRDNGLARQDPYPENKIWPRYKHLPHPPPGPDDDCPF